MKTRAIYIPDIRFNQMPIFELKGDKFICISDNEVQYDIDDVISDDNFIIVGIDEDEGVVCNVRN